MTKIHQGPFNPNVTYEAETINLWPDDDHRLLGLAVVTPKGKRVLIGISGVQASLLLKQLNDAETVLPNLLKWQPFRPA